MLLSLDGHVIWEGTQSQALARAQNAFKEAYQAERLDQIEVRDWHGKSISVGTLVQAESQTSIGVCCQKVEWPRLQFKESSIGTSCNTIFVKFRRCCLPSIAVLHKRSCGHAFGETQEGAGCERHCKSVGRLMP